MMKTCILFNTKSIILWCVYIFILVMGRQKILHIYVFGKLYASYLDVY